MLLSDGDSPLLRFSSVPKAFFQLDVSAVPGFKKKNKSKTVIYLMNGTLKHQIATLHYYP